MDITSLTAVELGKKIKAKEISVVEAVKASIAQIEKVEKDVNSFVTLDKEGALKRAEEVQKLIDDGKSLSDPIKMYLGDIYTISVNLAGLPGITIPVGKDSKGLPVGMQLIGNCFEENKIIQTAYTFEQTKAYEAPELAKEDR